MNLISCMRCGIVLNKDNLLFPDTHDHDTQEPIEGNYVWNGDLEKHVAVLPCPVCSGDILEEEA